MVGMPPGALNPRRRLRVHRLVRRLRHPRPRGTIDPFFAIAFDVDKSEAVTPSSPDGHEQQATYKLRPLRLPRVRSQGRMEDSRPRLPRRPRPGRRQTVPRHHPVNPGRVRPEGRPRPRRARGEIAGVRPRRRPQRQGEDGERPEARRHHHRPRPGPRPRRVVRRQGATRSVSRRGRAARARRTSASTTRPTGR